MRKTAESNFLFNLRRFTSALRSLFRNRLSIVGVVILIVFISGALVAPLIYPKNPQQVIVGAQSAKPEWVMLFPEGYYLSKNLVVVNDPVFATPSSLKEWSYSSSSTTATPYLSFSRANVILPGGAQSGSLKATSDYPANVTVRVAKTFHYPYRGPPGDFVVRPGGGSFTVRADGASSSQPVFLKFFLASSKHSFTLWAINITDSGDWKSPETYNIDNTDQNFAAKAGIVNGLSPAATIFPGVDNYTYGFEATFHGPATLYVADLGLVLYGTTFGLLGTDVGGGDLFAQDLYGARISLLVGLLSAFIGIFLGLLVGLIAGYKAGLTDEVLMRFTDMMLVIPALPLLLVLVSVLGSNIYNIILIIGGLAWMGFARVIRSQILSIKERPFIEAAKAAGAGTRHILTSHIFPNVVSLTYVNLALAVPAAILTEAALSFLGLGDVTNPSWGQILHNAQEESALNPFQWWWVVPPGIGIALVSISFVMIGYALDEMFNPRLRRRR